MGIPIFRVSGSPAPQDDSWRKRIASWIWPTNPVNPDPSQFKVEKIEQVGRLFVALVVYPNCTNYEGKKILVSSTDPRQKTTLDPHFSAKSGLVARFIPTPEGWDMAMKFAASRRFNCGG